MHYKVMRGTDCVGRVAPKDTSTLAKQEAYTSANKIVSMHLESRNGAKATAAAGMSYRIEEDAREYPFSGIHNAAT